MTNRPLSVVDYDAWNRGYMPPSEHVLIDKLAYRGARVHLSTPISREHQIWIVIDGPALTNKQRKAIRDMVNLWFEDEETEQLGTGSESAPGLAQCDTPSPAREQSDGPSVSNGVLNAED
ncbi:MULTISPECIES: hypothetical protein [unclassified Bradyrhizobium]|uniref:hypothetical protein n=1 Tax=unclassified Bradyrhizobium TaxID=2631580 RepID=UPI00247888AD|nr:MULTISPECIES: hypothetical protein [unclassified Bradyrhizobium]WGR74356.1 hypothetical protein MTX24_16660 [Bradyrhizobium sp. ISRA426]WGR79191.1 hypothetical protein MTX21_01775 [Bradyrhizobium sp. ISRA430]WGR90612.1 hypothetical protein MTX25_39585 [Bradyrhizobium sp. ISRA432]